jgi:hypothetical protein
MSPRGVAYGARYERIRRQLLDPPVLCAHCKRRPANTLDHHPPLAMHVHVEGSRCCHLIPSCADCNREGGHLVQQGRWRPDVALPPVEAEELPERDGLPWSDRRFRVPWLEGLRRPPADATWPRLMTVPHHRAVGSLGVEFVRWAERRSGRPLRWWQRLAAARILEVDQAGELVWETILLTMARQCGKSWLLRELCLWRIHQGERFGEPQDVLHTGKDLAVCKEVQRPARVWAKARDATFKVREVNGQEEIELVADGSRWMLRAKEAVYGYSVSLAAADEAWKVAASSIEEGLEPTMVERVQPQLLLVSTAHRRATTLMLGRRQLAIEGLEVGDGELLIEWSAPRAAELDDLAGWRAASPHWSARRQHTIGKQLELAREGKLDDPEEPDPIESFKAQWLNQWPRKLAVPDGKTEPLLPAGLWADRAIPGVWSSGPLWVGLEDDFGYGAAIAAVGRLDDGRLEVDGWLCRDWDAAIGELQALGQIRPIRQLLVGASLLDRIPAGTSPAPTSAGGTQTRVGLALLRDLAVNAQVVHDETTYDLDNALQVAHVREAPTGLFLVQRGPTHLIRAAVWALAAAHKPAPVPAVA